MKEIILFSLIISQLLAGLNSSGQIIYTDPEPDDTVSACSSIYDRSYYFDINNDSVYEYKINHECDMTPTMIFVQIQRNNSSNSPEIAYDSTFIFMNVNEIISDQLKWSDFGQYSSFKRIDFSNGDKIIAIRFKINDQWHYGWVRVNFSDRKYFIIKEYAYNAEPNEPIAAGTEFPAGIESRYNIPYYIFPNPAGDKINVHLPASTSGLLTIYDIQGRKVSNVMQVSTNTGELDISHLERGVYIFRFVSKDIKFNKRIIKK